MTRSLHLPLPAAALAALAAASMAAAEPIRDIPLTGPALPAAAARSEAPAPSLAVTVPMPGLLEAAVSHGAEPPDATVRFGPAEDPAAAVGVAGGDLLLTLTGGGQSGMALQGPGPATHPGMFGGTRIGDDGEPASDTPSIPLPSAAGLSGAALALAWSVRRRRR